MRGRANSALRRFAPPMACAVLCFSLGNCASPSHIDPRYGVEPSARLVESGATVPKGGGVYRVGSPYVVAGRVYIPQDNPHYRADGIASWYGSDFHGRSTANGEIFDAEAITAAHPTLPLPSYVRVTNLSNGRSLIARVNDRGPYAGNRIIDVSKRGRFSFRLHREWNRLGPSGICRRSANRGVGRPGSRGKFASGRARARARHDKTRGAAHCARDDDGAAADPARQHLHNCVTAAKRHSNLCDRSILKRQRLRRIPHRTRTLLS